MQMRLQRLTFTDKSTIGELYVNGDKLCYTLELPIKDALPGSAIPQGIYPVTNRYSPRFGRNVPHVDDIPNRSDILIHWGNYPTDTEGCILVGMTAAQDFIGESRKAFDELFSIFGLALSVGEICMLEVIGGQLFAA
jgi:hypothetical protein